jgi:branched-chain amino acid transport system permease protein
VILGAVLLTVLPEALRYSGDLQRWAFNHVYVDPADLRMLLFGLALVGMMLFRPEGLLPSATRRRELHRDDDEPEPAPLYDQQR